MPGRAGVLFSSLAALLFASLSASGTEPLQILQPASDPIVDYSKFGDFMNVGTEKFFYRIKDRKGLSAASAEGVDPNRSVFENPGLVAARKAGRIKGAHWDYTDHIEKPLRFYAWADAKEDAGVRQFYLAKALEDNGHLTQAIQAYYGERHGA